ncbi:hypothetical protein KKA03_03530, partial [archaeon]|nr:hypothetical protein [archaeon]
PPSTQEKKASGDMMDEELENALELNREIKNLWKLKGRTEDIPHGCLLIHEKAKLRKLKSAN